jgi:hypothetical protein
LEVMRAKKRCNFCGEADRETRRHVCPCSPVCLFNRP